MRGHSHLGWRHHNEISLFGLLRREKIQCLAENRGGSIESQCAGHDAALYASGHLICVASLAPTLDSTSVRPKAGKPYVTDGPFAETKEQIGSFFIIEVSDLAAATRIAALHPAAHLGEDVGWGVEVRPIDYFFQN